MKKYFRILLFISLLFLNTNDVSASTITYSRTDDDLGVNKKWNITEENLDNIYATPRVDSKEKIYDYAEVISEEEENQLVKEAQEFYSHTGLDIAIVTIDVVSNSYDIESYVETYASDFYDYNDFGLNDEYYSGIIIVRNVNQSSRYYNMFTFGNAQLYYPYERCESILDYVYDDLYNDNYLNGFSSFIRMSNNYYDEGIPDTMDNYYVDDMGYIHQKYRVPWLLAIVVALLVTIVFDRTNISKNKMVKKASEAREYLDRKSVNYLNKENKFISSHTSTYVISSSSGSGGGGGFSSSGGSSGGGHGGGGGRHG